MKINYRQLCVLVFMAYISLKMLALPSWMYVDSGNMSWFVTLILMTVDALYAFLIIDLMKKSGEKNIFEFMKSIFGSFFTRVFLLLYLIKFALVLANISKGLEFFVVENFYSEFNWLVFVLPLVILLGFMIYKGIRNIARVNELIWWAIVLGCIYIALKAISSADFGSFLPLFKDGVKPLVKSGYHHLGWFGSSSFIFMLFGKVDFKDEKRWTLIKYSIFAIGLVMLMHIVFYGLFDTISASHNFCLSDISQFTSEQSSIDELSWLIVALWVVAQTVQLSLYGYCLIQAIKFTFGIRNNTFPILAVLIYITLWSFVGENTIGLEKVFLTNFTSIITLVTQYIIPILMLIGYSIKTHKENKLKTKRKRKVKPRGEVKNEKVSVNI